MFEEKEFHGLKYLVRYPAGHKAGDKHPTILFLHGAGTRGDDLEMIRANSFFRITGEYEDFPFVCVAPQCRCVDTWYDYWETLKAFVKDILASDYCDEHRFYVIGNSMGGYATWQMGISMPEVIAAIAPICGGGVAWNTGRLKDVPVWAFHGGQFCPTDVTVTTASPNETAAQRAVAAISVAFFIFTPPFSVLRLPRCFEAPRGRCYSLMHCRCMF